MSSLHDIMNTMDHFPPGFRRPNLLEIADNRITDAHGHFKPEVLAKLDLTDLKESIVLPIDRANKKLIQKFEVYPISEAFDSYEVKFKT